MANENYCLRDGTFDFRGGSGLEVLVSAKIYFPY